MIRLINMKKSAGLYLSAREAAAELAVSPATLYAYVSRGLIRSEPSVDSRAHRYRAEDVRALKDRRAPSAEPRAFRSFDADLPVLDTAVSTITEEGPVYRGVDCVALSETASLEHTATLLWDATSIDPFAPDNMPVMSEAMKAVALATRDAAPIERAIAVLALAANADPRAFTRAAEGRALVGGRIMRLVVAAMLGREPSAAPLHLQLAERLGAGSQGRRRPVAPRAGAARRSRTQRLDLHGALRRLDRPQPLRCDDRRPRRAERARGTAAPASWHRSSCARWSRATSQRSCASAWRSASTFPGFGHGVYRKGDPRAFALLDRLARAGADKRFTAEIPEAIAEAAGVAANIDYALAVLMRTLDLPAGHETGAVCDGAHRRLDRACERAVAQRQPHSSARPLHRADAAARRRRKLNP